MDLIAQVVAAVLSFLASIAGNIFAHDICASANSVCSRIIKAAAARLAAFDQISTEQEWLVDLREHQTVFQKYRHAVGCYLAAPKMKRCALKAPLVGKAPGIAWKSGRSKDGKKVWIARWVSSPKARNEGYKVKSVRLWTGYTTNLSAEERDHLLAVTHDLQVEQDRWLYDSNFRMQLEAEAAERHQQVQELIALGHTRDEAIVLVYFAKSGRAQEPRG